MFENPRRGRQARNFTKNFPKILDLKSSSEQIFSENCRWVPLIKYGGEFLFVHPLVVLLYYWLARKLPLFCWPRMCRIKVKKNFKYNFEKKMKLQDYNAQELLKGRRFIWIKCLQHRVFLYPSSFPTTLSPSPSGSSSVQFIGGINHARLLVWVSSGSLFITRKSLQPLKTT